MELALVDFSSLARILGECSTPVEQALVALAYEDFGKMFDRLFPACVFFFFFEVKISSRTLIPLFMPGSVHSGSAS